MGRGSPEVPFCHPAAAPRTNNGHFLIRFFAQWVSYGALALCCAKEPSDGRFMGDLWAFRDRVISE